MYKEISELILYADCTPKNILSNLSDIFKCFEEKNIDKADVIKNIYAQIKKILEVATDFGFDENLWQNYLTFILITNENPFSITCEKVGASVGSVNTLAKHDFEVFYKLFHYDFSKVERELGIDCFSLLTDYKAIAKNELMYNHNV
ncbi:MAG: AAA family ATPase, partial [Lachnospira sp.]|nr:AAA family ATPase [Lachnospira sp.]